MYTFINRLFPKSKTFNEYFRFDKIFLQNLLKIKEVTRLGKPRVNIGIIKPNKEKLLDKGGITKYFMKTFFFSKIPSIHIPDESIVQRQSICREV